MPPSKKSSTSTLTSTSTEVCETPNVIMYMSFILMIIVKSIIISSLDNLEKSECRCSKIPPKSYLKSWFVFMLIYNIFVLVLFFISNELCWTLFVKRYYLYVLNLILGIINVVMLIQLFFYVRELKNSCVCAYGNKEKFIYWYLIIVFSIMLVLFLLMIILAVLTYVMLGRR
jgi:small-conductance mechanosensitive channel